MTVTEHHPFVRLARTAIDAYVREGRIVKPGEQAAPVEGDPAGVFVTLRSCSTGELRGCIGTIQATEASIADEIIHNAISAAVADRRFAPVVSSELDDLEIEVSLLHPAERIESMEQLDPRRYGVIVQQGRRRGLLLPDIPGIDDARTQVDIARQKAWIGRDEPVDLWRFEVDKFE